MANKVQNFSHEGLRNCLFGQIKRICLMQTCEPWMMTSLANLAAGINNSIEVEWKMREQELAWRATPRPLKDDPPSNPIGHDAETSGEGR